MSLNGVDIPNLVEVEDGIYSGGQPTAAQLAQARDAGLASVISLCPDGECGWDEKSAADGLGLEYASIPVAAACDLTDDAARQLHETLARCPKPALVHCGSGNRVGALLALKAHRVEGHSKEVALDKGRRAGLTSLEGTVTKLLGHD